MQKAIAAGLFNLHSHFFFAERGAGDFGNLLANRRRSAVAKSPSARLGELERLKVIKKKRRFFVGATVTLAVLRSKWRRLADKPRLIYLP